jgi:hypothetical protein
MTPELAWVHACHVTCVRQQGPKGTSADKLRLALVQLLAAESPPSDTELQELTGEAAHPYCTLCCMALTRSHDREAAEHLHVAGNWVVDLWRSCSHTLQQQQSFLLSVL